MVDATIGGSRVRYRELFATPGFLVLWSSAAALNLATTMTSLGLGVLVHRSTGSAFLSAAVMFGPYLAHAVGGLTTMSVVDAWRPRPVLGWTSLLLAGLVLAQAGQVPVGMRIVLTFAAGYVLSISMGARYGALSDLVDHGEYALGRSAINIAVGVTQMVGYSLGAVLMAGGTTQGVFVLASGLCVIASVSTLWLPVLSPRSARGPGLRETWDANRRLLALPGARPLLLSLVVPNGMIVGCEALFVAFEHTEGGPGVLFTAGALGMLIGDVIVGRYLSLRGRLGGHHVLRFTLALPFIAFALEPPLWVAAVLVCVATTGYGASLVQQEVLNWLAPRDITGQVLGFESAMRMAGQGLFALVAGALAEMVAPSMAIMLMAMASLAVSASLTHGLRAADAEYARASVA